VGTCALFIDYENVYKSLIGQNIHVTHKQLAEVFKAEASKLGEVIYARAYAPWDIYPEAMSVLDRHDIKPDYVEGGRKDNADLVMSLQIQEFLRLGRDADTFILVTGDGDFIHVIRILQQENKRVVVWGVEGSISSRLAARVAELVNIQTLLANYGIIPSRNGRRERPQWVPTRPSGPPSRDTAVRALILRAESVMLARGWVQVPFLTLLNEMGSYGIFGSNIEQNRQLIVRCLHEEILETKKQPNPKRPGTETTFILLKKENPTVALTLKSAGRVILHMRQLLAEMPGASWVSYSLLDKALANDPEMLEGSPTEAERRAWIDLCVAEGLLRLERKENPRNPEFPTSVLYLNEEHPFVQQIIPGEDPRPMLMRLIVHMDQYLTRTGYLWMSMGLLRQHLVVYGRREMERAIRIACESGVIIVRQQPNQFGVRPTTGAYLQMDHPHTREALALRDAVLDALLAVFGIEKAVPRAAVLAQVRSVVGDGIIDPVEWIQIMVTHQVLQPCTTEDGKDGFALNRQHPAVARRGSLVS